MKMTNNYYIFALLIAVASTDICYAKCSTMNQDFSVSCRRSLWVEVVIYCRTTSNWSNFPTEKLKLPQISKMSFKNCSFPTDLNLYNITQSLGVRFKDNQTSIKFDHVLSGLSRENLRGFPIHTLSIIHGEFDQVPKDLLYDISLDDFFISSTNIEELPSGFFEKSENLKDISIINNKLKKLTKNDFSSFKNLKKLYLYNNEINEIESGTFDKLFDLRKLEISKNSLKTIPPMIFKNLARLELINLSDNEFTDIPADLLVNNSKLEYFRMSSNRNNLNALPSGFFKNLSNLKEVHLSSNGFVYLPVDLFSEAFLLRSLDLSNNSLRSLPMGFFESMNNLEVLWLMQNKLVSLPDGLFKNTHLKKLYLHENRLTSLTSGALAGLSHLETLDASHNNLSDIDTDFNKYAPNLEFINLSNNELTLQKSDIPQSSIFTCSRIKGMDLSYNKISKISTDWGYCGQLKSLNLRGNKITYLEVSELNMLNGGAEMILSHNLITTVNLTSLEGTVAKYRDINSEYPEKNVVIYLDNNPLNCNCQMMDFVRYSQGKLNENVYSFVRLIADDLRCSSPSKLLNFTVKDISMDDIECSN